MALVESCVAPQRCQGTADKVSGGSHWGRPAGWQRAAADFHLKHDPPKPSWVRERVQQAGVKLRAPERPAAGTGAESDLSPRCRVKAGAIRRLREWRRQAWVEFRRPPALA